ncbi:MAG TPA: acyltransferase domain-containing protein, partial [Streptosporangiaceae bacterium]|nr:acyltransferase domain-containing protein [Streptosporangiaceae bacterium]
MMWGGDERALDGTGFAQPALFAVQVALFRLLESWGVRADYVAGHSVGEVSAAYVSGVLSLADACALVAARARLMQALPAGGVMVAVGVGEEQVVPLLGEGVSVAAVNGPSAVVISGQERAVLAVAERLGGGRRLRVSHAFHSALMEPMLAEFGRVAGGIAFGPARIPLVSTVTGGLAGAELLGDPGYWVRQVRDTVRFADGVRALRDAGASAFLELGPDGGLAAAAQQCLDGDQHGAGDDVVVVPALRRDRPEEAALATALARLHVAGVPVQWAGWFAGTGARRVDLPTYPFQRERFWPRPAVHGGDVVSAGLTPAGHPLLGAAVPLAGSDGVVFTSRLSLQAHPWLADHTVGGMVLFPGTGFLELAVRAGDQVGCGRVEELTLAAPLVLTADSAAVLQVSVGEADEAGARRVRFHARPEHAPDQPWTEHAAGVLVAGGQGGGFELPAWPPADAAAADLDGFYEQTGYGPVFRGLRAVWRRGGEAFAEVELAGEAAADAAFFGLHPALLDAVLHAIGFAGVGPDGVPLLPFSWSGVSLHAAGASRLRARITKLDDTSVSVVAVDAAGAAVVSVESLTLLPPSVPRAAAAGGAGLLRLEWVPAAPVEDAGAPRCVVLGADGFGVAGSVASLQEATGEEAAVLVAVGGAGSVPEAAHELAGRVLGLVQQWLADGRFSGSRLVFVTRGATTGQDVAAGAVWGLVRSAQAEHPGRFVLVDVDVDEGGPLPLPQILGCDETQFVVRGGVLLVGRLARLDNAAREDLAPPRRWDSDGTVLITGGAGGLGRELARHLVAGHGVRHLLLASRRGLQAPGAAGLAAELSGLGAQVSIAACDLADRQ